MTNSEKKKLKNELHKHKLNNKLLAVVLTRTFLKSIQKKEGNMDEQVKRGQAPKTIERVDKARIPHEKDHVTFKDETALNYDGTWKHGIRQLINKEKKWILKNGWKLPPS